MVTDSRDWSRERGTLGVQIANLLAPVLILLAPFAGFLSYHDYGLWRPESLISATVIAGAGLAISAIIALRPALLRPAMVGLLLMLFLDLHFRSAEGTWLKLIVGWEFAWEHRFTIVVGGAATLAVVLMGTTWLLRRHVGVIVSSVFGVMVLATILIPPRGNPTSETLSRNSAVQAGLPPIVHLVLDGQIGIEGLPLDIPGGPDLRRDLTAFYEEAGFRVFSRAYSQYDATYESLSNLLNGQARPRTGVHIAAPDGEVPRQGIRLRENAWFRVLSDRGYRIRVYHTDYLDFCTPDLGSVDYCFVAPGNSISSILDTELSLSSKVRIIVNTYLSGSFVYRVVANASEPFLGRWVWRAERLGAISAASVLDRIARDLQDAPRGTAFFGHLLIPHGAYVFDADCRLRPDIDSWLGPSNRNKTKPIVNSPASREIRYRLYFDQVRCTHRKLAALLREMEARALLRNATVIVHGDHGSRINILRPMARTSDRLSDRDIIDSFSTLFAVRKPGIIAGSDSRSRSIQDLFAETLLDQPRYGNSSEVYLIPSRGRSLHQDYARKPMPRFGD